MALDNVVLMLWPTINPDGQTMVTEWYRGNVGTPFEVAPLPKLYQEYVGHDNNRDGYMLNMIESRVMEHAWREWEPQIIHVHHQTAPFPTRIWLPPFAEPIASRVPFLLSRQVNMIGMAMAKGLEEKGQVGAHPHGHRLRCVVPRLHRLQADAAEHRVVLDRDGALPVRDTALLHAERLPGRHARPASPEPLQQPVAGRLVAPARCGGIHGDGVAVGHRLGGALQGLAAAESLQGRHAADREVQKRTAVRVRGAAAATRSGGGRRTPASPGVPGCARVAAHRRGHDRRRAVRRWHLGGADGSGVRRDRAAGARGAEVPGAARVTRWSARAALRRGRLDAAVSDGRRGSPQ